MTDLLFADRVKKTSSMAWQWNDTFKRCLNNIAKAASEGEYHTQCTLVAADVEQLRKMSFRVEYVDYPYAPLGCFNIHWNK